MRSALSVEEDRFVNELLSWDRTKRPTERVLTYMFLVLGWIVFLAVAVLTLQNLTDRTVLWVLLPGTLMAVLFFGAYVVTDRRIRERALISSVLRKLRGDG